MRPLLSVLKLLLVFFLAICLGYLTFSRPKLDTILASTTPTLQNSQLDRSINQGADININRLNFSDLKFELQKDTNLFLILYSEYQKKSHENAIKGVAALEGLSQGDARLLIESNFTNLKPIKNDNERSTSIQETYESEKELFKSLALLENRTLALEIFTNGSRGDSNFDLLVDLDDIERILFAETPTPQFGDLDLSRSTSSLASSDLGGSFSLNTNEDNPVEPDAPAGDPEPESEDDTDSPQIPLTPVEPPANELSCPIDLGLQQELVEFEADQAAEAAADAEASAAPPSTPDPDDPPLSPPSLGNSPNQIAIGAKPSLKSFANPSSKCTPGSREFGNLFCLRVEKVRAKGGLAFSGEQYCIACVLQKIRETTDELMSESLMPRKITGNFGEPAICKSTALKAFSLNINFVPKPARADLDLISPIQEITPSSVRAIPVVPVDLPTQAEVLARADAASTTLTTISDQTLEAQDVVSNQDSIRLLANELDPQIDAIASFAKEMVVRLTGFQQNFVSLKEQLSTIRNNLNQVSQKPVCSSL